MRSRVRHRRKGATTELDTSTARALVDSIRATLAHDGLEGVDDCLRMLNGDQTITGGCAGKREAAGRVSQEHDRFDEIRCDALRGLNREIT